MERKLCPICQERLVAINCHKNGRTYYRKICDACNRRNKRIKPVAPLWFRMGYKKKAICDRCGFRARTNKQMFVLHVDGDLSNVNSFNLKTVCANCKIDLYENKAKWKASPQVGDF